MRLTIKYSLLLFLIVSFNSFGQEISEKQHEHIRAFVHAVENHSVKKVIKLMNKTYKKEQLAFLKGNKDQFVSELFGGTDFTSNSEDYINIVFSEITKIEVAEVIALKKGGYTYIFRIRDGNHDILSSLRLVKEGRKYGFIGSVG